MTFRVYGWTHAARMRRIVAAKSVAEVSRLSGTSTGFLKNYGSWTGNETEIATATAQPGVVFEKNNWDFNAPFTEVKG